MANLPYPADNFVIGYDEVVLFGGVIMMRHLRLVNLLWVSLFLFGTVNSSLALKKEVQVDTAETKSNPNAFARIPGTSEKVVLLVEDAGITVNRTGTTGDISVQSKCPRNWNVSGSLIRQAGFAKPRQGVSMMADALGSRAIVNGKIYPLPSGGMKGLSMGKDGVSIGGVKVEPLAGAPGAIGECDGADAIEVTAPNSFNGGLMLGISGNSQANISSWKNGALECTLMSGSSLKAGKIGPVDKLVIDLRGKGNVDIDNVAAKVLVVNVGGPGTVTIKGGSADLSNFTVTGNGVINAKGKFKGLNKGVQGTGSINLSE